LNSSSNSSSLPLLPPRPNNNVQQQQPLSPPPIYQRTSSSAVVVAALMEKDKQASSTSSNPLRQSLPSQSSQSSSQPIVSETTSSSDTVAKQRLKANHLQSRVNNEHSSTAAPAAATRQDFAPPVEALKSIQQIHLEQQQQQLQGFLDKQIVDKQTPPPLPPTPQPFPKVATEWSPVRTTPKIAGTSEEVNFAPDALLQYTCSPFSGALHPRNALTARFRKHIPSLDMSRDVGRRMAVWDPYWRTERILSVGLSSPVDATNFRPHPGKVQMEAPQTVVSCHFHLTRELMQLVSHDSNNNNCWGNSNLPPAKDGESRLILRMLPLQAQSKKRADCHLWPKGTYCAIDGGAAQRLYQRKQQSHAHDKWLGMCKHLDMTSVIPAPNRTTPETTTHALKVACLDAERYFFCISICTFQHADTITSSLLHPSEGTQPYLQKLTLEESIQKAMALITQPINLDDLMSDGDDDAPAEDVGRLVFTLTCPLSKALMKIPVRGRCCKHWQVCKPTSTF
jgi:hypothetical protein